MNNDLFGNRVEQHPLLRIKPATARGIIGVIRAEEDSQLTGRKFNFSFARHKLRADLPLYPGLRGLVEAMYRRINGDSERGIDYAVDGAAIAARIFSRALEDNTNWLSRYLPSDRVVPVETKIYKDPETVDTLEGAVSYFEELLGDQAKPGIDAIRKYQETFARGMTETGIVRRAYAQAQKDLETLKGQLAEIRNGARHISGPLLPKQKLGSDLVTYFSPTAFRERARSLSLAEPSDEVREDVVQDLEKLYS